MRPVALVLGEAAQGFRQAVGEVGHLQFLVLDVPLAGVGLGDNMSRWDSLWMSMPMSMGLGLSGQPFVGVDIGGFGESTNPELLARWMQYGVPTPFCRNHSNFGNIDQYPWSFGPAVMALIKSAIQLRYRLMPALYTAFIQSSEAGLPIQRPLVLDY